MNEKLTNTIEQLEQHFTQKYSRNNTPIAMYHAPGRVNLIGEHIDYNGGVVFPAALSVGTTMLARPRSDGKFRFMSTNFPEVVEMDIADTSYRTADGWANYPKAAIHHLMKRGYTFTGADLLFSGDIPNGAGLSSSASIEVVTAFGLLDLAGVRVAVAADDGEEEGRAAGVDAAGSTMSGPELALICQEAENEYIGVNCGIMDQFAVTMGQREHAILLNCGTLDYERIPFKAPGYKLVIGNTNKQRGLADSEYNVRRAQCEQAVQMLRQEHEQLQFLCELTPAQFEKSAALISDDVVRRRAEHAVMENDRVMQSVAALRAGDLPRFGQLMNASHQSLKDLYEVSCLELDVLVEEANHIAGVLGSRMTGAGFGGCNVSLVADEAVESFITTVGANYKKRTGIDAEFYVCEIGDGVKRLR